MFCIYPIDGHWLATRRVELDERHRLRRINVEATEPLGSILEEEEEEFAVLYTRGPVFEAGHPPLDACKFLNLLRVAVNEISLRLVTGFAAVWPLRQQVQIPHREVDHRFLGPIATLPGKDSSQVPASLLRISAVVICLIELSRFWVRDRMRIDG